MKYIFIVAIFIPSILFGQSLSIQRVTKIKDATVRIIVDGGLSVGSGFFISEKGLLVTCLHVVKPAITNNKKIYIQFNNGDTTEAGFPERLNRDTAYIKAANAYDFCILSIRPGTKKTPFLKLGKFENVSLGEEIYTCGYPLGMPHQFISKGILSTKYINNNIWIEIGATRYYMPREEALLDITLNKGNSGGPIVKIGKNIDEDEVIGIANFIVNPLGSYADSIINSYDPSFLFQTGIIDSAGVVKPGMNVNKSIAQLAEAYKSTSIGISGTVSINYLNKVVIGHNIK